MRLLERDDEENAIRSVLSRTREQEGGLVLVEGPAGIGKSSLLALATHLGEQQGAAVGSARGSALERSFSFGIALGLFGPLLAAGDREALLAGAAQRAAPLFDASPEALPAAPGDHSIFGLLHALYWLTAGLAERRPLLLMIDDAQWADEPSLRFVHYLAQRIGDLPVVVALAVRTSEPGSESDALLALRTHPGARVLALRPLSAAGTAEVVRSGLPGADDAFCDACARATAGNPFYLRQLIDAASSEGLTATADGAARLLALGPLRVSRSVLSRMGRLSSQARALAVAVAVAGDGTAPAHAAELAGLDAETARTAADVLARADILASGEPLGFAHPLVREVIYADLPAVRRSALHREAARLLAAEGHRAERVAAQLLLGATGDAAWARDALREAAGRARARGASAEAAGYLRRALQEHPPSDERGELLAQIGLTEAEAGEGVGTEALAEAVTLIADPQRRARHLFDLAMLLSYEGRHHHAAEAAARGRQELGEADAALAARLAAVHAMSATYVDLTDAAATARRVHASLAAADLDASPAGRAVLGHASVALAFAETPADRIRPYAERAVAPGAPADDPFDVVAFQLAAFGLLLAGEIETAERAARAAIDVARRRGSMLEIAATMNVRAMVRFRAGRVAESIADADAAVEAGRWGWGTTLPMAHAYLVFALLERGDVDRAEVALELPGGEERWMANVSYGMYLIARAAVWRARGRGADALQQLLLCGGLAEAVNARHPALAPWRAPAVALLLAHGDREEAIRLAAEDLERARAFGATGPIGAALRGQGLAVGGDDGLALLSDAEQLLAGSPARLEHARTLVELGAALRRSNQRAAARDPLRRGLDLARRGGALVLAERAHVELRAAGARPRRLILTGADSLTPSERRVAELAGAGLTNREIAQELFLTVKTVEAHLGHAYRKLGISSRKDLGPALGG